ncbi:hypothetical protein [Noviherbaspirillum sp.]|jgi:hypothetical protein|uniref:hypothetical protein n=1 Tax=Noviherbaspirillum sp. TaxID=1926288 RepID=UPI0025FE38F0|nr:hypothetical protein [Noviherbaspirillum sp.]
MKQAISTWRRMATKSGALQFKNSHVSLGLVLGAALTFSPCLAWADSVTVSDDNSSLKFNRDDPVFNLGVPSDPVQLPRTLEWTVDGRRILVYPSGPSILLDIGHLHPDSHVGANQMHAQGPMLGYGTGATAGTVTGGVVYAVDGGAPGSGESTIREKADIINKTSEPLQVSLAGLGFKPTQENLEVPDLKGLSITGTTTVFYQGSIAAGTSITDPPFGPVAVLPVVSFSGFNPLLNQNVSLPAGATLTMITELKVKSLGLTTEGAGGGASPGSVMTLERLPK